MTFSPVLQMQYAEMMDNALHDLFISSIDDFPPMISALQLLVSSQAQINFPENLSIAFERIRNYLAEPELYVESEEDYQEYQAILKQVITEKITALNSLTHEEKNIYISQQKKQKEESVRNHAHMAQAEPPAPYSEAHVSLEDISLEDISDLVGAYGVFRASVLFLPGAVPDSAYHSMRRRLSALGLAHLMGADNVDQFFGRGIYAHGRPGRQHFDAESIFDDSDAEDEEILRGAAGTSRRSGDERRCIFGRRANAWGGLVGQYFADFDSDSDAKDEEIREMFRSYGDGCRHGEEQPLGLSGSKINRLFSGSSTIFYPIQNKRFDAANAKASTIQNTDIRPVDQCVL